MQKITTLLGSWCRCRCCCRCSSAFYFQQLYFKHQRCIRADVRWASALTISQAAGNPELELGTGCHQLQTFGPTSDHTVEWEFSGRIALVAGIKLFAIKQGAVAAMQPLHWVAEIAAVLARETPATAQLDVKDLLLLPQFQVLDSAGVWERAIHIASTAKQHVFDTLYHAVALEWPDAVLVTADEKYFRAQENSVQSRCWGNKTYFNPALTSSHLYGSGVKVLPAIAFGSSLSIKAKRSADAG